MADDGKNDERTYDAQDITVLEGLEAVRKRPGMYIGDTGARGPAPPRLRARLQLRRRGPGRLLPRRSTSRIHADGAVTVTDDGRGIPVDDAPEGRSSPTLEVVLTDRGRRRQVRQRGGYKVSAGLHGIGAKAVTALSE